jgi:hypothetical protein
MENNSITTSFYKWIEDKSKVKHYPFYFALVLMIASLILVTPNFSIFNPDSMGWSTVKLKSNDLTNSLTSIYRKNWNAKKVFRLTVPVIMRITHAKPLAILVLQYILGYFTILFLYKLAHRITTDPISSSFTAAGIVFLYFGRAAFYDIEFAWFDGITFFALITAMYSRNFILIFLLSSLAAWTDERGFIALSIVLLYHQLKNVDLSEIKIKSLITPNIKAIAVISAIALYISLRLFLTHRYNMHTPSGDANYLVIQKTLPYLGIGMWTFIEGFWMMVLFSFILILKNKNYVLGFLLLSVICLFTLISGCVLDVTRSGSFMVPVLFIFLLYLKNIINSEKLRFILFISFIISLLFPPFLLCLDPEWHLNALFQFPFYVHLLGL